MKVLLTVVVIAVVLSLSYLIISIYKPEWLDRITLDKEGFPYNPKEGDEFTKDNTVYVFTAGQWISKLPSQGK